MTSTSDLEQIKQAIAADPFSEDEAIMHAIAQDETLKVYRNEMQALEEAIQKASNVAVPEGLAAKLSAIPEQELNVAEEANSSIQASDKVVTLPNRRNHYIQLAMAASIAFAVGLSFTFFGQSPDIRTGADLAMAHMYHEQEYTQRVSRDVSLDEINTKLATFGGEMLQTIGKITYANFCFFENQKSLHMVMQTEQGNITLFVTPEDFEKQIDSHFQDSAFEGKSWKAQKADVTIIGEKGKLNEELESRLKNAMRFSA
ncbi:DUF3379 family protein [Planctobacterium marinum]|uniref:DUF3379 domain-containing protein n=1 Tax=Planctobacterium marinum TaxID=1631968 RepID=A0AA48HK37_9ALTE|nr:hypothetical protein MACH26_17270 [Planctobacterium marinum]